MKNDLERLLEEYKELSPLMDSRQLAEAERELYDARDKTEGPSTHRMWLKNKLGGSITDYEIRGVILNSGQWALPFWDLIDRGVAPGTVVRMHREARARALSEAISIGESVQRILEEQREGKFKQTKKSIPVPAESSPEFERVPSPVEFSSSDPQMKRTRLFVATVESLVADYLAASLESEDETERMEMDMAAEDFRAMVRELCDDTQRWLYNRRSQKKKQTRTTSRVTRDGFRQACDVLGVRVQYGETVNLRDVRKSMLRRAADLHPDRNQGSHAHRAEYQAVVESFKVLEEYAKGQFE